MRERHATAVMLAASVAIWNAVDDGIITEVQGTNIFADIGENFSNFLKGKTVKPGMLGKGVTLTGTDNMVAVFNEAVINVIDKCEPPTIYEQEGYKE